MTSSFLLIRRELYTPVVGDILDQHWPLFTSFCRKRSARSTRRWWWPAILMPVLQAEVFGACEAFRPDDQLLDAFEAGGEVYVGTGRDELANWGEIMTAAAKARGG